MKKLFALLLVLTMALSALSAAYEHVLSQSDLPRAALYSVVITLLTALFTVLVASV